MTNYEIQQELKSVLSAGETLVWVGKPRSGFVLRGTDAFLIPFSIFWGGFAFFWEWMAITTDSPLMFRLWGIPFVLIGIYFIFGRFIVDIKRRSNTIYGITQNRIIIQSGVFAIEVKSLNISALPDITIERRASGTGTILFGHTELRDSLMQGFAWPGVKQTPRFEFIEDVKNVYDKIIELQQQK